ncbi:hypothetical protein F5Y16DRAFT_393045 [Xylariaceae sp. FL0255]|nr:hypothetical protein F5Y16DRAFT_393045 [Xylariaceae sp. FL0255]
MASPRINRTNGQADEGCPEDTINSACEDIGYDMCCAGDVGTEYYSAEASDGASPITLYSSRGDRPGGDSCAVTITEDDTCPSTSTGGGTGAAVLINGLPDPEPTSTVDSSSDSGSEKRMASRREMSALKAREAQRRALNLEHARSFTNGKETYIEKNARAPVVNGMRQVTPTSHALLTKTHVYKLSRDSPMAAGFEALSSKSREERVDYLKRHGKVYTRSEAGLSST